ncbi:MULTISPECIES: endonuclease III [unclassified Polynucleobacter]|jgi:endonuclease-3|uniref:endonuclease III n=1 Tax=unclassified Polynucleobacter TaxID=2640945 RepID=UPI001BFD7BF3|nr:MULTISPECIES: endonuclease III [unclassified Polynucleobacter]MBU3584737.1 endonuclease III [Polynucleobacter sp. AM-26B4]QWD89565.1 endonuclease III [Polynucleobacter sp. MWH-CaK5]
MNPQKRLAFFEALKSNNPKPTTELEYTTPFELLAAVLLSAQATDVSVNKGTRVLFPVANTPEAIHALGVDGLIPYIQHIGLFKTKAKHLIETCRLLIERHGGVVPEDREALEALPGVGRKTANVILNTAFGHPTMAVDTHIFRVSNRTGLAPGKDVLAVEMALLKRVPKDYLIDAHHWLILHGRYTCKARSPDCAKCIVEPLCSFKEKNFSI